MSRLERMRIPLFLALLLFPPMTGSSVRAGTEPPDNLVIITVDTTRVDHLSAYGYPLDTSPNIDRLAAAGVLFESATSQIPLTGPAHISLMTSRYPRSHGAIRNGVPMKDGIPTLAGVLSGRGYATAAFISGWTLRAKLTGLNAGFQVYDDDLSDRYRFVNAQRHADQVTDLALEWLNSHRDGPFFLWVHYFDPHTPYRKNEGFYRPPDTRRGNGKNDYGFPLEKIARYDSEIGFMDHHIGRLLDRLDGFGRGDRTLVVLIGDHGESFGEHQYAGHGRQVYESTLHVPMVFRFPGHLPAGLRSPYPSQTIDVMPTVLALLGIPAPADLDGHNLGTALQGVPPAAEPEIYFETFAGARKKFWRIFSPPLRGVPLLVGKRVGSWKYIYDPKTDSHELYNLAVDPDETDNRIADHPEFVSLGRFCLDRLENPVLTARDLDTEDRKALESLGYME